MIIPVVLAGGAGTRLWPVSREGHPKPFMKLGDGESLLVKTYKRAAEIAEGTEIITVTNRDYYFISKDEFIAAGIDDNILGTFLLEPEGRNTAPAIALAAQKIVDRYGPDAKMLVLSADHLIQDTDSFIVTTRTASALANEDYLVTFGIRPWGPETGFGYIEAGDALSDGRKVVRFVEKPSLEKAKEYIEDGNFFWNSGMFCFRAGFVLEQFMEHAPDVANAVAQCWKTVKEEQDIEGSAMLEIPEAEFGCVEDISVDYALMERSQRVAVVPADFGWSDIGNWNAVKDLVKPDTSNNRAVGDAVFVDSRNTFVQSEDRLVATVGVQDLVIVDTPDALLVSHPDKVQDVKQVVAQLKNRQHVTYKLHRTVIRPWGSYTILEEGPRFKIKRIEVKPGASLSLQMHHHRSEHWIVVSGMAKVVNGDQNLLLNTNQSTYIPAGHVHRLENPGVLDLVMIEVQSGDYLGEDDIVRLEDNYGRI